MDVNLFYTSMTITIRNGVKTLFWDAPWVQESKPKDITPLIYEASTRKKWKVQEAFNEDAWVSKNQDNDQPLHG